jgi:hypothetical protein
MLTRTTTASLTTSCLVLTLLAASGCASRGGILGVDCCADIPAGAIPEPAGTKVCDWQTAQVAGATADQTVFYEADFIGNSAKISPDSIDRIARAARSGLATSQPSIIEPSGDDGLDAARVTAVSLQLDSYGITQPIVNVATPAALGMQGIQAERIADGLGTFNNGSSGPGGRGYQSMGMGGSFGSTITGAID